VDGLIVVCTGLCVVYAPKSILGVTLGVWCVWGLYHSLCGLALVSFGRTSWQTNDPSRGI